MSKKRPQRATKRAASTPDSSAPLASSQSALIFISHDARDADLAEEFDNLLRDASGGMLKSFRSSDRKGTSGMEYGEEWYSAIMSKLGSATNVVALLTPHSIDRPWILYEAGVAKGKIGGNVLGVAIGTALERVSTGPFFQFQNCGDDEDSLTGLVMQLVRSNPGAEPREEAVKIQVRAFRDRVAALQKKRGGAAGKAQPSKVDESAVAKLFEEVKVMFRDLPEKLQEDLRQTIGRRRSGRRRMIHPGMLEDLMFSPAVRENPGGEAAAWLMLGSLVVEDMPWLHEIAMEVYRALGSGSEGRAASARAAARKTLRALASTGVFQHLMHEDDSDVSRMARHLPEMLEHFLKNHESRPRSRPKPGA
jgi:hypothetical protein